MRKVGKRETYLHALSKACERNRLSHEYVDTGGSYDDPSAMSAGSTVGHQIVCTDKAMAYILANRVIRLFPRFREWFGSFEEKNRHVAARILSEPKSAVPKQIVPVCSIVEPHRDSLEYKGMRIDVVDSRHEKAIDDIASRVQNAIGEQVTVTKDKMRHSPNVVFNDIVSDYSVMDDPRRFPAVAGAGIIALVSGLAMLYKIYGR